MIICNYSLQQIKHCFYIFFLLVKIMKKPCCFCCGCRSIERQWFSNLAAATVTAGAIREFLARGEGRKLRCPIRNRGRPQKERIRRRVWRRRRRVGINRARGNGIAIRRPVSLTLIWSILFSD